MTNRDSDALFLPASPPQHAAPVGFLRPRGSPGVSGWFGRVTRLALRLLITTVAWGTGLGLVVGSILLVAAVTAPRHSPRLSAVQRDNQNGLGRLMPHTAVSSPGEHSPGSLSRGVADSTSYRVVAAYSGHGDRTTKRFKVTAKLPWQLRWTYRCTPKAEAGQFTLLRGDIAAGGETLRSTTEEYGARGHGSLWFGPTGH